MNESKTPQTTDAKTRQKPPSLLDDLRSWAVELGQMITAFGRWMVKNPIQALLLAASIGIVVYFFGFVKFYMSHGVSAARWMWPTAVAYQRDGLDFRVFVPFIFLGILWATRKQIAHAEKHSSNLGLIPLIFGALLFLASARAIQPRIAIIAVPMMFFGAIYFLYGWKTARYFVFPCAFLWFLIPFNALVQMTAHLQLFVSHCVMILTGLVGIHLNEVGTTFTSTTKNGLNFDIAEGCSGIHSLMAMAMITSIYAYFTQNRLWKMVVLFALSLVFAIIGNICRIFSIVIIGHWFSAKFALGFYHEYSDYLIFPFAIVAMIVCGALLNFNFKKSLRFSAPKLNANHDSKQSTYDS